MIDLNWKASWQLILKKSQVSFSGQSQGLMEQNALNISWVRNWVSKDLDEKNAYLIDFKTMVFFAPPHIFSWPRSRFGKAFQNVTEISIKRWDCNSQLQLLMQDGTSWHHHVQSESGTFTANLWPKKGRGSLQCLFSYYHLIIVAYL